MLKIQGKVVESTNLGIKGDMIFLTTTNVANAPTEVMRIASDGNVHVTGSLGATGLKIGDDSVLASIDEDNFASNSATKVPTQQSVKAYVDANAGGSVSGNTFATDLKVGRDADNLIDFTTDNNIVIRAGGENQLTLVDGALTPTTNAIVDLGTDALEFKDGYFDGTLEADAITIGGTNIDLKYVPINGSETTIVTTFAAANGTVGTATNATHVTVTDNESTNEDNLIPFIEDTSATGNVGLESDGDLYYNPSTGKLTATQLAGTLQTAAQSNITSVGTLTSITSTGNSTLGDATGDTHTFVGNITASGDISSSGNVYSDNIETFHGSARLTNLAVNNYSGPNFQGIMRHEWTRKLAETVNDNNTIEINRQDIRTGIIIPYAFKITGFTMFYGVNKNGTQTIPQGALFALQQSEMDLNDNSNTGAVATKTAICTGLGQGTKGYNTHLCTGSCDVNMPAGSSIYYRVKPTTTVDGTTMDMNYTIQWKRINE